jgi:hypothetical protein
MQRPTPPSRLLRRLRILVGVCAVVIPVACSHAWDDYDPRAAGSAASGSGGGTGGEGGGGLCQPGAVVACYTGTAATLDIGACTGGTAKCNDDGLGFGACIGEVTPRPESCDIPGDEDCDGQVDEEGAGCPCTPDQAYDCYEGPDGTADVGLCATGVQVCDASGTSLGPCLAQVLPAAEDCSAGGPDEDCDGIAGDHCATWAMRFGGPSDQDALGVATDSASNVVIVGEQIGGTDFGGGTITSAGSADVFVAKFALAGDHQWSKRFGDAESQYARAVALDAAGNVIVAGLFSGTLSLGGTTLVSAGDSDVFVAKLDAAGNHLWSKRFGGVGAQGARGVAVDAAGDVIVTGDFAQTINFGGSTFTALPTPTIEYNDGFIAKLSGATGAHIWSMPFGSSYGDSGRAVVCDASNNVYVGGYFNEDTAFGFGGPVVMDQGLIDGFVVKLDPSGNHVWSRTIGPDGDQSVQGIGIDAAGNVTVAGYFEATIELTRATAAVGETDIFVAHYDPAGALVWSKVYGSLAIDSARSVAVTPAGLIHVGAIFGGTMDCGEGPLTPAGPDDALLLGFSAAGDTLYTRRFGDSLDQDTRAVAVDPAGRVYLVGAMRGTADFGTGVLTSAGGMDAFVAQFAP